MTERNSDPTADESVTALLRHVRTGTLWEGRYTSHLVDSADYVLRCYRYIELTTVRARLIEDPTAYRWSSCAANLG